MSTPHGASAARIAKIVILSEAKNLVVSKNEILRSQMLPQDDKRDKR